GPVGPAGGLVMFMTGAMALMTGAWLGVARVVVVVAGCAERRCIELFGRDHAEVRLQPVQRAHHAAFLCRTQTHRPPSPARYAGQTGRDPWHGQLEVNGLSPRRAVPTRTHVEPYAMACSRSPLIP